MGNRYCKDQDIYTLKFSISRIVHETHLMKYFFIDVQRFKFCFNCMYMKIIFITIISRNSRVSFRYRYIQQWIYRYNWYSNKVLVIYFLIVWKILIMYSCAADARNVAYSFQFLRKHIFAICIICRILIWLFLTIFSLLKTQISGERDSPMTLQISRSSEEDSPGNSGKESWEVYIVSYWLILRNVMWIPKECTYV